MTADLRAFHNEIIELTPESRYSFCRFINCEFTGYGATFQRCQFISNDITDIGHRSLAQNCVFIFNDYGSLGDET